MKLLFFSFRFLILTTSYAEEKVCGKPGYTEERSLEELDVALREKGIYLNMVKNHDLFDVEYSSNSLITSVRQMQSSPHHGGFSEPYSVKVKRHTACLEIVESLVVPRESSLKTRCSFHLELPERHRRIIYGGSNNSYGDREYTIAKDLVAKIKQRLSSLNYKAQTHGYIGGTVAEYSHLVIAPNVELNEADWSYDLSVSTQINNQLEGIVYNRVDEVTEIAFNIPHLGHFNKPTYSDIDSTIESIFKDIPVCTE